METSGNNDQKDALRSIGLVQPPVVSGSGQVDRGRLFYILTTSLSVPQRWLKGCHASNESLAESREPDVNSANFIPEDSAHILQYSVESMK